MIRFGLALSLGLLVALSAEGEPVAFRADVAPLLQKKCLLCHAGERAKGGLDLTTRAKAIEGGANGPALAPGKAAASKLFKMVADGKMPPKNPLSASEIETLRRWIDEGAKWDGEPLRAAVEAAKRAGADWWSLQPIRRPSVPNIANASNPIDAFILSELKKRGLSANPPADRRTLIRRVTLDLTGLRPTPDDVAAFEADPSPLAYERLVDRLLASPAYGERWGRHWLDVVRFAESSGYEVNNPRPNAWGYRDYVIRALNRDVPFKQFVREQLASDTVSEGDPWATGFLVGGSHDLVGNQTEEGTRQIRSDDLFDMVSTTSTAFLGLTAGCARCHDHKFDPIAQRDFYALEAIFAGVVHEERPLRGADRAGHASEVAATRKRFAELDRELDAAEPLANPMASRNSRPPINARRNVERFEPVEALFVRMTISATNNGAEPCIDEFEIYIPERVGGNLALTGKATASSEYPNADIHKIRHLNDGKLGNSRSWISAEAGRGWAQIELPRVAKIDTIVWGRDREQKFVDRVPSKYRIEVSLDGKDWRAIASDSDRGPSYVPPEKSKSLSTERMSLELKLAGLERVPTAYIGNFKQPSPTFLLKRGDVMQPGDAVTPGAIRAVGRSLELKANATDPERRTALADWLADPMNPLPARVMVNRVWHFHFGQGLVRTPSDFGFNGDRPSHPELLDWLASEFRDNGGYLKPIHRLIVMSNTYRQSSRIDAERARIDTTNRALWRFPSRRIEAEAVRDTVLQTTGTLNRQAGGPGYQIWNTSNYVTIYEPKKMLGPDEFRRMVYQFKPRTQQDGTFGAFDCPDATTATPRRPVSTTALQALNLLNDAFVHDQADRFAERVRTAGTTRDQVNFAFRFALQRAPSEREASAAERLLTDVGLNHLCRMLLNANEFVTLE